MHGNAFVSVIKAFNAEDAKLKAEVTPVLCTHYLSLFKRFLLNSLNRLLLFKRGLTLPAKTRRGLSSLLSLGRSCWREPLKLTGLSYNQSFFTFQKYFLGLKLYPWFLLQGWFRWEGNAEIRRSSSVHQSCKDFVIFTKLTNPTFIILSSLCTLKGKGNFRSCIWHKLGQF